jgi:hypothetical protein
MRLAALVTSLVIAAAAAQAPKRKPPVVKIAQAPPAATASAPAPAPMPETKPSVSRITRVALQGIERSVDRRYENTMDEDPFAILGATRGVYLDGYGVVFSTEIDLSPAAAPNPFGRPYGRGEILLLREKKKYRIDQVKASMRELMMNAAATLEGVRAEEKIALSVTIPYFSWEKSEGLPRQIIMVAPRRALLDAKAGGPAEALTRATTFQELF